MHSHRDPRFGWIVLGFTAILFGTITRLVADENPKSEKEKIEGLIEHIANLQDAKFVRNGAEYDAKTAAKFLRGKWESNASEIKTAADFIEKAASVSSTTGKPYLIRFKDGKETKSGEYLLQQLKRLEGK